MSKKIVFTLNENITDRLGNKWKIIGFLFSTESIKLRCEKGSERKNFNIASARNKRNQALTPGKKYKLTAGTSESKYAIELKESGSFSNCYIAIEGNKDCKRIIQKIPVHSISLRVFCGTKREFDQQPESYEVKVGDRVKIRNDNAAWHSFGKVEKAGQVGIVTSINKGQRQFTDTTTIEIDFDGVKKSYSLHRIICKDGYAMSYGWKYRATRKFGILKITPLEIIDENKLVWFD